MNRRVFLQTSTATAVWSFAPGIAAAQGGPSGLWHQRPLRIYHPNPRESELATLDVKRFVAGGRATEGEAVVISVGGVYAFYPSQVKCHYASQMREANIAGEIARAGS